MTTHKVADRYVLRREIGRGAAGAVWLADDEVLGREVALKRIGLPPGAADADVDRAEREARLAARVNHPHVVAVFDFVAGKDEHWLVTEYVAGTTLAHMIRDRGALPPAEAARILAAATRGLAAAHELGIVHRDVKPSNILVGTDGTVMLSDFGIARGTGDDTLTRTGLVTGSPAYLAPEVATGASATVASDVWSVGASLHHALAGATPYRGDDGDANPVATLYRIAHEPPPTIDTEPWAAALLAATMTHDPRRRPTALEVAERLSTREAPEASTQTLPELPPAPAPLRTPGRRVRRRDRRPLLVGLAAVVLLLAAAGGIVLATGGEDDPDPSAGASPTTSTTDETSPGQGPPTAGEMEAFARTYVETASSDPDRGIQMLTEDYRAASPDYHEFWESVRNPRILAVSADPEDLRVSYTYEYSLRGEGRRSEDVVLQLVQDDGELLIAGDS